jgi:hypothetical protein
VLFVGHPVVRHDDVELRTRDGLRPHQLLGAVRFRSRAGQFRARRPNLRFEPQSLLGPVARLQGREGGPRLIELTLQGLEPGLELVLAELADQFPLGDLLPLLDRQFDEQTGDLEGELGLSRSFGFSGKGADVGVLPVGYDHRLDGANRVGADRGFRRASRNRNEAAHDERPDRKPGPELGNDGVHGCIGSPRSDSVTEAPRSALFDSLVFRLPERLRERRRRSSGTRKN